MVKEGLLQCGNWPFSFVIGNDDPYVRSSFSRSGLYVRNSSDSSEDWSTSASNCENQGNEEDQSQFQNGGLDHDKASCLYPEANDSRLEIDGQCLNQSDSETGRRKRETFFCSKAKQSTANERTAFDARETSSNEKQQLKESSTNLASKFMPPQDQSMLATPGNRNSPGFNLTSSPNSAGSISINSYRDTNGCYMTATNTPESEAPDLQLAHQAMPCSQTLISDCSTSECDISETNLDELKNGELESKQKMSSNETIYPWMKESRQNPKKKQSTSVSSAEENDKTFTGNKRERTAYTNSQLVELEKEFHYSHYLCRPRRIELANSLNLSERQIKIWFQNRRMKFKKEQKQKIAMPRNPDLGHGIGSLALPSGHQRHYSFSYFPQQHRPLQYTEDNEGKCKSARYPRMDGNRIPFPIHSAIRKDNSTCRVTNAVQSPTQQLQSFVSSSMPSVAPLHHHQVPNQAVPCSPTTTNNPTVSPMHANSLYNDEQRGIITPTMGTSPNHERLHSHLSENCPSSMASAPRKDRIYEDVPTNSIHENGIRHFNKFSAAASGSFNTNDRNKNNNMQRNIYQSTTATDMHNCRHYHPRYCHQNSQMSSFGEYAYNSLAQDGADMSLRHSFTHGAQRGLPTQFLPFAYYGSSPDIDYLSTAVGVNSDKGMPIDYSRTAHPNNGFGERFSKSNLDKPTSNSFVSPGFARLTHL